MVITRQGSGYFKLQSGERTVLIDPEDQRSFRGSLAVIATEKPFDATQGRPAETRGEAGGPFFIDNQGEYDAAGVRIEGRVIGYEDGTEKTAYRISFDDIAIGIMGQVQKEPDPKVEEILQDCDILIIPAGDRPYLGAATIAKIIRQTEPGVVIPSYTENPKALLKELGQESNGKPEEKFTVKKKEITPKALTIKWIA